MGEIGILAVLSDEDIQRVEDVGDLDTAVKLIEATKFSNKTGKFLSLGEESISKGVVYRELQR